MSNKIKYFTISLLLMLSFSLSYADEIQDQLDVKTEVNNMRNSVQKPGILGDIFTKIFDTEGKIKTIFYDFVWGLTTWFIPYLSGWDFVNSPLFVSGGNVGIWTTAPSEKLDIVWSIKTTSNIQSWANSWWVALTINDWYGNANITFNHKNGRPEQNGNAARIEVNTDWSTTATMDFELKNDVVSWVVWNLNNIMRLQSNWNVGIWTTTPTQKLDVNGNVNISWNITVWAWINWDSIQDGTVDSSEIQDNTITTTDILNNTITETDISDSFKARDSDKLDWIDSLSFTQKSQVQNLWTVTFNQAGTTTSDFITKLTSLWAFNSNQSTMKASWSYAWNQDISDTWFWGIELAWSVVETFKDWNYKTVRVTRPNTWAWWKSILVYNDQWSWHSPGWRKILVSWDSWDYIADWTIDSSEIQDNTLTASDLAANSVWTSEITDNTVSTTDILNNTITETDISDSFKARDSDKLDWINSTDFLRANADDYLYEKIIAWDTNKRRAW